MLGHLGSDATIGPEQHMLFDATKPVHYFPTIAFVGSDSVREDPPNWDHVVRLPGMLSGRVQDARHHVFACPLMCVSAPPLPLHFHVYTLPTNCATDRVIWADSAILAVYRRQILGLILYREIGSFEVSLHYVAEIKLSALAAPIGFVLPVLPTFQMLTSHWLRSPMASTPTPLHERRALSCADRGTLRRCGGVLRAASENVRHASR